MYYSFYFGLMTDFLADSSAQLPIVELYAGIVAYGMGKYETFTGIYL